MGKRKHRKQEASSMSKRAKMQRTKPFLGDGQGSLLKTKDVGKFAWVKLKSVEVLWPVQIVAFDGENIKVFIKSDDAEVKIWKYDVKQLFPGDVTKLKQAGIDHLMRKNKTATTRCFENDVKWAQYEYELGQTESKSEADGDSLVAVDTGKVEGEKEESDGSVVEERFSDKDETQSKLEANGDNLMEVEAGNVDGKKEESDGSVVEERFSDKDETQSKLEADGDSLVEVDAGNVDGKKEESHSDASVVEERFSDKDETQSKSEADGDNLVEVDAGNVDGEKEESDGSVVEERFSDKDESHSKLEADGDNLVEVEAGNVDGEEEENDGSFVEEGFSDKDEAGKFENEMEENDGSFVEEGFSDKDEAGKFENEMEENDGSIVEEGFSDKDEAGKFEDEMEESNGSFVEEGFSDKDEAGKFENEMEENDGSIVEKGFSDKDEAGKFEDEMEENDGSAVDDSLSDSDKSEIFPMLTLNRSLPSEDVLSVSDESSIDMIDEDSIIRDVKNPEIYISRVMKNTTSKTGKHKKHDRVHNSYQFCGICKVKCSNFSQHISRNAEAHGGDPQVKAINQEKDPKIKKKLLTALRGKFNHTFNMTTVKNGKGEILLERRPIKDFNLAQYGPCPQCFLWIAKVLLKKHQNSCSCRESVGTQNADIDTYGSLVTRSDSMSGRIKPVASQRLINETFPKMKNDKISETAKTDTLIIQLGNQWIEKNVGNKLKRGVYTSQIMRLAGRFLLNLRQLKPLSESSEVPLWDYLEPQHFESLVQAALLTCSPAQDDEENWAAPSNALKLGYDLKRMCNGKIGLSIMNGNQHGKEHASNVLQLMQLYWVTRVTKAARVMLEQRRFHLYKLLPDPDDIITLNKYLNEKIQGLNYEETDGANFRKVAEVIQAKLVMYNRRRSGELQSLTLLDYARRQKGESGDHLVGEMSDFERKLLRIHEVVSIRGKLGRRVPVLITKELQAGMTYLADSNVRTAAGVATSNPYLFASQGQSIVWAYDSLKKASEGAHLKYPERITSTNLRKSIATMTQVLDLKTNEFQWVLNHLGHTMDVHKIHYRATSDILERTQVAKLLMLQDQGRVGEFKNQSLEDIQFEDVVEDSQSPCQSNVEEDGHEGEDPSFDEVLEQSEKFYEDIEGKPKTKPKDVQRRVWSPEEEEEIKSLFKKFFDLKKRPKPKDCMKAIRKSRKENGWIHMRKKDVLKKKVFRMVDKLK